MTDQKVPDWVKIAPSVPVQCLVPQNVGAKLKERADAEGLTVSAYVRDLIRKHLGL